MTGFRTEHHMDGLGQAMALLSSSSVYNCQIARASRLSGERKRTLTKRSVLEREGHHILDPLDRGRQRVAGESLADDDLDATDIIARSPVVLEQEFAAKVGEPQPLELARLCKLCAPASAPFSPCPRRGGNRRTACASNQMRAVDFAVEDGGPATLVSRGPQPARTPSPQPMERTQPGVHPPGCGPQT